MYAIFRKELRQFFSSLIGYIAIGVFLLLVGFMVWFVPEGNILDAGYANLDRFFFNVTPFVLVMLIPAITMRSFSEEMQSGTIELLATRPLTDTDIIFGKFFAALALVLAAIAPTLIYFYSIYHLASPIGNVDIGGIIGCYFGLIFLSAVFVSISLFTSSITKSQIVAFIGGAFICFVFYYAIEGLASLGVFYGKSDYFVEQIGLYAHYESIGRGIIDTRDVVYFLSIIALFTLFTRTSLASRKW
jgi:ABC-2 type transport system permease protein